LQISLVAERDLSLVAKQFCKVVLARYLNLIGQEIEVKAIAHRHPSKAFRLCQPTCR
jgi:hypothetical protein